MLDLVFILETYKHLPTGATVSDWVLAIEEQRIAIRMMDGCA